MQIELVNLLHSKYAIIMLASVLALLLAVVLSAWVATFYQQAHARLADRLADEARENGILRQRVAELERAIPAGDERSPA